MKENLIFRIAVEGQLLRIINPCIANKGLEISFNNPFGACFSYSLTLPHAA
jgi:hypothetical protein